MTLELTTVHVDGAAVVKARGALDFDAVTLLREYLQRRLDAGDEVLVLDLIAAHDAEPSWGAAVAAAGHDVESRGGRVVVVATEPLRSAVAGAASPVAVAESVDAALGALSPAARAEPPHVEPNDPNQPPVAFGA